MKHLVILSLLIGGCGTVAADQAPETLNIPAGPFIAGSDQAERDAAYRLDEAAYGHDGTRQAGWYDAEGKRREVTLRAFRITATLITNGDYACFIDATGHTAPNVDANTWTGYGLIHPFDRTRRHAWIDGNPPKGREDHPVVLVSYEDAEAYAA